ncbi:sensor histidine kinase [Methylocapsa palsarum]|uniref:histidine kinase n=1 Tax=Methylocapsa palsarum TaxID=1612308 RepID=A0A1I3W6J5_9HYPH|nr:HAMP domain-containing sensor histidine kinase [Methylocapsa palsarum]SFK03208.1 Signal transduction histidine kinase [Methylocapsa palsarum]
MRDLVVSQSKTLAAADKSPAGSGAALSAGRQAIRLGLASRVLLLITAFVMAAATMIYIPAVAGYRDNWLRNRLSAAHTAALVLEAAPSSMIPEALPRQLLESVGARVIVLSKRGTKKILAASELPPAVDEVYDMRHPTFWTSIAGAVATITAPKGRVITILGHAPMGGESVAITMDEAPLKDAMRSYSWRLFLFTLVMSAIVSTLASIAIHLMVLRPLRRLTTNLVEFGADPENAARVIVPSGAHHEIGRAEEALAVMQEDLARELSQKKHLATLGLAVAKINHDMRNMLTSAQLLSDRLANVTDPLAQRLAPKLVATLDRAIRFCQATMTYGRAVDEPPKLRRFLLRPLVDEAVESAALGDGKIAAANAVSEDFEIVADAEQMFRVLMNLIRNAADALQSAGASAGLPAEVRISARREDAALVIEVEDTGPGVPPALRPQLFKAFSSSSRAGGSGLGLAIAADLVLAHGGRIRLISEAGDAVGAKFRITLPLLHAPDQALQP